MQSLALFGNPVLLPPPITPSWCCVGFFGLLGVLILLFFLARQAEKREKNVWNKEVESQKDDSNAVEESDSK